MLTQHDAVAVRGKATHELSSFFQRRGMTTAMAPQLGQVRSAQRAALRLKLRRHEKQANGCK
jgi:hypothetical protein